MTANERPTRPQLNEEALFLDENGNLRSLSGRTGAVEDPFTVPTITILSSIEVTGRTKEDDDTFALDPVLKLNLVSGVLYQVMISAAFVVGSTGVKFRVTCDGSTEVFQGEAWSMKDTDSTTTPFLISNGDGSQTVGFGTLGVTVFCNFFIRAEADAVLGLEWAQNSSGSISTTLNSGVITATPIG